MTAVVVYGIDFASGIVTERVRDIDSTKVLAGNALFGKLSKRNPPGTADLNGVPKATE